MSVIDVSCESTCICRYGMKAPDGVPCLFEKLYHVINTQQQVSLHQVPRYACIGVMHIFMVLALSCITTAAVAKASHHYCFEVHAGCSVWVKGALKWAHTSLISHLAVTVGTSKWAMVEIATVTSFCFLLLPDGFLFLMLLDFCEHHSKLSRLKARICKCCK